MTASGKILSPVHTLPLLMCYLTAATAALPQPSTSSAFGWSITIGAAHIPVHVFTLTLIAGETIKAAKGSAGVSFRFLRM
jgi:hypothetical protein